MAFEKVLGKQERVALFSKLALVTELFQQRYESFGMVDKKENNGL